MSIPVDCRRTSKTVTFTGAAGLGAVGAVPLFAVTGQVLVVALVGYCTADLTDGGGTATLALGVTGATSLFVGATTATAIDAGEFWVSTTPTANGIALPAAAKDVLVAQNIVGTVAAEAVTGGAIRFDVLWVPVTKNASLAGP